MTLTTYPLDNVEYTADDAALFHATRTTGIYAGTDFAYSVNGADNTVMLGPGIAWMRISRFKGIVTALKVETAVDAGLPDPIYPRIDHIVLQYNANSNTVEAKVKNGTASSNPKPPVRSMSEVQYEIHTLRIRREPGAVAITATDITDLRLDSNWCGLMADSVTNIDTDSINRHVQQLLLEIKTEADSVLKSINQELKDLQSGSGVELAKLQFIDTLVPVSAFVDDTTYQDYPYRASIALENIIQSMIPEVVLGVEDATSGNFGPVAECYNGGVYIYAAAPPDAAMTIPTILCWRGNA